jgi:cytochrome c-type biogenesis protein CcmH/NrfF
MMRIHRTIGFLAILAALAVSPALRAQEGADEPPVPGDPAAQGAVPHVEAPGGMQEVAGAPPVAKRLFADLVCLCGGCKRETLAACTCGYAKAEREKVLAMLAGRDLSTPSAEEKAYVSIRDALVKEYGGQHILTVPIDAGFNRLAWIVPWAVFALALTLVLVVGQRWVQRGRVATATARAGGAGLPREKVPSRADEDREDRLDDELRDID